jgi:hypothetical protein
VEKLSDTEAIGTIEWLLPIMTTFREFADRSPEKMYIRMQNICMVRHAK